MDTAPFDEKKAKAWKMLGVVQGSKRQGLAVLGNISFKANKTIIL
jgi:hypothetical protein